MNRRLLIPAAAAVAIVCMAGGHIIGAKRFTEQRGQVTDLIANCTGFLNRVRDQRQQRDRLSAELAGFVSRTLGGKFETVDSRLRERLNRIGEELQLSHLTVSTSRPAPVSTPAKSRYARRTERALRDEIDFVELEGSVSGEGSLEQALRLAHRVQAEPWIKRLHQFKLEPRDNGRRFVATLRLTTLYLPDREPRDLPSAGYDGSGFAAYATLAAANPFRVPEPPAPSPPPSTPPGTVAHSPPQPPEAPSPYSQWRLTLIAQSATGPEVGLLNTATGEAKTLLIGQSLQQATLVAVLDDQAQFTLGEDQFLIGVGQTMDHKTPLNR